MATVPYPKSWNSSEVLTAADLNAQFAAVASITGLSGSQLLAAAAILGSQLDAAAGIVTGQLAAGAAIKTFQSAAFVTGLSFTTTETTLVTLPSVTTRGGRVILFGFGGLIMEGVSGVSITSMTWRFYRDAGVVQTTVQDVIRLAANTGVPAPTPLYTEAPAAGSYVYKLTGQMSNTDTKLRSSSVSAGTMYLVEFA